MMCFLAADLDWLFASQCHVVSEDTRTATEIHLSALLCAGWFFLSSFKRGQGQSYCGFPRNRQSTIRRCIADGEQH